MHNMMIDLETLGSVPGCAILSIGAVMFDPVTQTLGEEFYRTINLNSCLEAGLTVEAPAFYWWMQQEKTTREALLHCLFPLETVLMDFAEFFMNCGAPYVWSHGASFDLAVLSVAYHKLGLEKPWKFRNERDTRTLLNGRKLPPLENAHHALNDARSQANGIMHVIKYTKFYHEGSISPLGARGEK